MQVQCEGWKNKGSVVWRGCVAGRVEVELDACGSRVDIACLLVVIMESERPIKVDELSRL